MGINSQAQATAIEIGTVIESSLAPNDVQSYELLALETLILSIRVDALDEELDPQLQLVDSSGNVIISNDDYNYPENRDAIIQAFVIPRTDTYTIEVSAFGDTSGAYRLSVLPGYDVLTLDDTNNSESNWQVTDPNLMQVSLEDNTLTAEIEGIAQTSNLINTHYPEATDLYFEAQFSDIMASDGWQVGLIFRYINPTSFYRLILNNQGFWQLERIDGENTITVKSWSTHPGIVPGENAFTLGILTSGQSFDIIYNRQLVGTAYDSSLTQAGAVGVTAVTANALNSRLTFTLEETTMTTPTQVNDQFLFPEIIIANNYSTLAHLLERQQIIPVGGEVKFTTPQISIRDIKPGVSRFPVASGVEFTEFVLGGALSWESIGEGNGGCGIAFNDVSDTNYTIAYVNQAGEYGVSQRDGDSFHEGIFGETLTSDKTSYTLLVIVYDDTIEYFIDNKHVGTMPYAPQSGEISTAVVNFDGVDTTCIFDNLWLWSLDNTTEG